MQLIKQPNTWTCVAACACMLTGTTLDDFYLFCGHDGSEKVPVTPTLWQGVKCFSILEISSYLNRHNMLIGCGGTNIPSEFNPLNHNIEILVNWEKVNVLVTVKSSRNSEGLHQILWSKELKRLIDPMMPEKEVQFSDYKVVEWWPVVRVISE